MYIGKILMNKVNCCRNCGKGVLFYVDECPYCNAENVSEDERSRIFDEAANWSFRLLFAIPILSVLLVISIIATFCFDFNRDVKHPLSECKNVADTTAEGELCYIDIKMAELWFYKYPDIPGGYDLSWLDKTPAGNQLSDEEKALMYNVEEYYYLAVDSDGKMHVICVSKDLYEAFQRKLDEQNGVLRIYGNREPKLEDVSLSSEGYSIGSGNADDVIARIRAENEAEITFLDEVNQHIIIKADLKLQEEGYFTEEKHWIGFWLMWFDICLFVVIVALTKVREKVDAVASGIKT